MKKLSELYDVNSDVLIKGISINSKQTKPGDIFVCTMGVNADRHEFIDDAVSHGASAIVVIKDTINKDVPVIKVKDTNKELPKLCSKFYDHPEDKLNLIGITGTDGKTTTATIIQQIIGKNNCGYIGSNGYSYKNFKGHTENTTPDSHNLYKYFKEFVDNGCKYCSMETSSEAFFRKRLENIEFDVAIITNITEDHLNIHKTLENYIECKGQLFKHVKKDGICLLNIDDSHFEDIKKYCTENIYTYGKNEHSDFRISNINLALGSTTFNISYRGETFLLETDLSGEYNIYNLTASFACCYLLGVSPEDIINAIKEGFVIEGRGEKLNFGQDYTILLDYAHTTNAIHSVLSSISKINHHKIISVLGSAGGREKEKRAAMGLTATKKSDMVIFTMDDPRYEKVIDIVHDMLEEVTTTNYMIIEDRKEAIWKALSMASSHDIVAILGKGRDDYMAVEDKKLPYCDYDVIKDYFENNH